MTEVVPLISVDTDGCLKACDSTLTWISSHTRPFGVITIIGKYRTGKSTLMNLLSECTASHRFKVGDSVEACTKGLWIRKQFVTLPSGLDVLYMDTEGIDALDASSENDVRILTFAMLLSSLVMYNSVGHIDEAALGTLSVMTRVADCLRRAVDETVSGIRTCKPNFVWVLRDFSLRLEDAQGTTITEDEYLTRALTHSDGATDERNSVRTAIRDSFLTTQLVTMPRPGRDDSSRGLDSKPHLITAKFHNSVNRLRQLICDTAAPIQLDSTRVLGSTYATMCRELCKVDDSSLPRVKDTWSLMAEVQVRDACDVLLKECDKRLNTWECADSTSLRRRGKDVASDLTSELRTMCVQISDAAMSRFQDEVEHRISQRVQQMTVDTTAVVQRSLERLEVVVASKSISFCDVLAEERAAMANYGDTVLECWGSRVSDKLIMRWMDLCFQEQLAVLEEATLAKTTEHEGTVRALKSERDKLQEECITNGRMVTQLRDESEDLSKQLVDAQDDKMRCMAELSMVTEQKTAAEESLQSTEREPDPESSKCTICDALELRVDEFITKLSESTSQIAQYKTSLRDMEQKLSLVTDSRDMCMQREQMLTTTCRETVDRLRAESEGHIATLLERSTLLRKDNDALEERLTNALARERETASCLRVLKSERERDVRQATEAAEETQRKFERLTSDYNKLHTDTLADIRKRDERASEARARYINEQAQLQAKNIQLERSNEGLTQTITQQKRKMEDGSDSLEIKRMKIDNKELVSKVAAYEVEIRMLRERCEDTNLEKDVLQKRLTTRDSEVSVLRAERDMCKAASLTLSSDNQSNEQKSLY